MTNNNKRFLDYEYISEGALQQRRKRLSKGEKVNSITETMKRLEVDLRKMEKQREEKDFER